jgi:hypothetical protein
MARLTDRERASLGLRALAVEAGFPALAKAAVADLTKLLRTGASAPSRRSRGSARDLARRPDAG